MKRLWREFLILIGMGPVGRNARRMVRVKIRQVEREYAEIESVADSLFRVDLGREWSDELIYQKKVAYADEKQRALNHFSMQIFVGKKREEN